MVDYIKTATLKRTGSGSIAVHVISRESGKRVLLGTYMTDEGAREAIRRYANGEPDKKPAKIADVLPMPQQQMLWPDD